MRFWLLACLCVASSSAMAGLFADDDARKQVKQLEARIVKLEQALASTEQEKEQYIRSTLDLQMQMEALNTELRKLRGQNEELIHSLQDAEKRQKDFYVDLDSRLRRFEGNEPAASRPDSGKGVVADPAGENRTFEAAYSLYKAEKYQNAAAAFRDFLQSYPQSVHEANVLYWTGNSFFLLKECKSSIGSYQTLIEKHPDHPRVQEAMLNVAECQLSLKSKSAAQKTLKQLISQFPGSDASEKAKKRLAAIK
ncbi:MAG TPA: tol-pal system protein YbgF [Gallionellaceae bacterium]|nr:tol-pal system protein YbgF [Gallionellaceae bacterium]